VKYRNRLLALLLLSACGSGRQDVGDQSSYTSRLNKQIERIKPELAFCGGVVAEDSPNNLTGEQHCGTGDSMLGTGIYVTGATPFIDNKETLFQGVRDSINEEGRAYRSPQYKVTPDPSGDSYSRDQLTGFLLYLIESRDVATAERVWKYYKKHDYVMCPDDTDGRCTITPNMMALISDTWKHLGLSREAVMTFNRGLDESSLRVQAKAAPTGYPLHLISLNIWLRYKTGNLTKSYADTATVLKNRQPNNLWFAFLDNRINGNDPAVYEEIAKNLFSCMSQWPMSENKFWWTFSKDRSDGHCEANSQGHELVWLASLLAKP